MRGGRRWSGRVASAAPGARAATAARCRTSPATRAESRLAAIQKANMPRLYPKGIACARGLDVAAGLKPGEAAADEFGRLAVPHHRDEIGGGPDERPRGVGIGGVAHPQVVQGFLDIGVEELLDSLHRLGARGGEAAI